MRSLILETAARLLTPLLILFSMFLLLRGHQEPGGGFAGGLLAGTGFALYVFAVDPREGRKVLPFDPHAIIGLGLLIAAIAGALALTAGLPYFTGIWIPAEGGETPHLGTPLLFDVGVYLVVAGITVLIVQTLAEE